MRALKQERLVIILSVLSCLAITVSGCATTSAGAGP
jgi:predicted small secreted protein